MINRGQKDSIDEALKHFGYYFVKPLNIVELAFPFYEALKPSWKELKILLEKNHTLRPTWTELMILLGKG